MKVLITGGGGGIGFAVATAFAEAGHMVVLADLNLELLNSKVEALTANGHQASAVVLDLNSQQSIEQTAASVGAVDILINNAGIGKFGKFLELSPDEWKGIIDTNLMGVYYVTR
ncbi:MAG: SDR family NAD(P)-dependent oxidoreductase, partial [Rheinheimera sp.]